MRVRVVSKVVEMASRDLKAGDSKNTNIIPLPVIHPRSSVFNLVSMSSKERKKAGLRVFLVLFPVNLVGQRERA